MTTPVAQASAVLVAAGGGLMLVAGWRKLTSRAVTSKAFRLARAGSVTLGSSEIILAIVILGVGGRVSAAIIFAAYGGFTCVTVWRLVWPGASRSCACFGAESAQVTWLHALVDALFGTAGAVGYYAAAPSLLRLVAHGWMTGLDLCVAVAASVVGLYALLTASPGANSELAIH